MNQFLIVDTLTNLQYVAKREDLKLTTIKGKKYLIIRGKNGNFIGKPVERLKFYKIKKID